ncbi:unnamed protein product [Rhizoctonia solani]|uniref:Uncharacterized protein n=1 Tax=Rhizoctonia solani TaxID=456999 RepID=A0A8H3CFB8_9AGAM|nr:unnamed protein product [Rhizoctonia solani]
MAMTTSVHVHIDSSQLERPAKNIPYPNLALFIPNYEIANHWSEASAGFSQSGDQAAALDARQKAVEVYRLLHANQPEQFEGNLARELLGLSKDLGGIGQIEEAFKASQESARLYRHILGNSTECDHVRNECQGYWGLVSPPTHIAKLVRNVTQIPK